MENRISIRENLFDLFRIHALEEGYMKNPPNYSNPNNEVESIRKNMILHGYTIPDLFSMLTHFFLLYDKIEMPFDSFGGDIKNSDLASMLETSPYFPISDFETVWNDPLQVRSIPNELAITLKPYVINACMNDDRYEFISDYCKKTAKSVKDLYGYIYDRCYNKKQFVENDIFESDIQELYRTYNNQMPVFVPETEYIYYASNCVEHYLRELLLIRDLALEGPRDFYAPSFSNYNSSVNINDAYCILKNQISMIMDVQPAFSSLKEIIDFRKKNQRGLELLRDEVSQLEALLRQGDNQTAIQKAINDVRSANQSLLKNTTAKKIAKIATYISVPISLLEFFTFGTSYSMAIGVVGTTAQWISDKNDAKQDWLFVAR